MTNPGLLAYTHQARQLAAAAEFGDVVWADCDCDGPFADGAEPECHDDRQTALRRYFRHKLLGTRYWGVHNGGRHLLHVHAALSSLCPECRRRRAVAS